MKILDCTYTHNWEGEPIIHLYGVGGKHITRSGHRPYFYAEFTDNISNDVAARLLHSRGIHDFVKVEKFRPIGYQSKPTTMYQIFTISPKDVRQLREEVSRIPNIFKIYEADIPYKNRWLIDNGLGGFADIDCGEDAPISYCSFDIECLVPPEGTMPTSDKDPIILISMAFSPQFEGNDRVVLSTKPTDYQGCPVIICKDEHHLITTFLSLFNTYNPDIIAGYNTNQFDFPYLQGRCKVLDISPKCTRDNREWYIRPRFDGGVDVTITGRVVVDLLPIIRANYSLNRYNLATAASLVNYEKLDVSPREMRNAYLGDDNESWDKVIAYSDRDAELVMRLLLDLKLIDKYIAISQVSGTLLQDVVNLGQTKLIDNLIIREFKKAGRVMNMRPKINEDEEDDEVGYTGGSVLEPETGLHEHIITMDYTSLFPSIMRAYNICPTMIIKDEQCDEKVVLGNNVEFSTKHVGIVPQILERLFNERVQYKTMMKTTKDTTLYNQYDNMQYALKILLNSVYGMFGFTRARLYDVDIASSVTYVARDTLLKTKTVIEENPNLRVIAGDSVIGSRCVTIRKNGFINVVPIEKLFGSVVSNIGDKEYSTIDNCEALTHLGWKPIKSIMRHKTGKKIYRVGQKYGESITTEDHSFMSSELDEVRPIDMDQHKMYKCDVPAPDNRLDNIDLYEYIKRFKIEVEYKGSVKINKFALVDGEYIKFGWTNRKHTILVKRFICGNDLKNLCILLGGYITNGSSTFGAKRGASICDSNVEWLSKMQDAYNSLFINATASIIESNKKMRTLSNGTTYKDETRKLQMMNSISAAVFTALCGHGAYHKKLPDFTYNLDDEYKNILLSTLIEGDGTRTTEERYSEQYREENFRYSTVSEELISGISTLLSMMKIGHVIRFRPEKHEYIITQNNKFDDTLLTKIQEVDYNGYVYDLEVEDAHTFCDSCGNILLHNTDSCMIKINNMECTYDVAKNIAMDIHDKMTKILPPPMNLDFEAYSDRGVFLKKKRYAMRLVGPDGNFKLKMRGIETRRRDFTAYTVETLEEIINILLSTGDKKQAASYANLQVARIKNLASINDDPELVKKLLLTKKFSRPIDGYKAMMPHIEAIKRAIARGETAPSIGDRIAYYVTEGRSKKISDLTELESYAHDKGLGINKKYYLEKQLIPPINRIFEAINYNWVKEESNSKQKTLFDL